VDRVKWFRDRAVRDRAREEKEILECEFQRVQRSFPKMADVSNALAKQDARSGHRSYAYRQASMHVALNTRCQDLYLKVVQVASCQLFV
jgi:hypothetical protein